MQRLLSFSRSIDRCNTRLGAIVAWAVSGAVLAGAAIRRVFSTSCNFRGAAQAPPSDARI